MHSEGYSSCPVCVSVSLRHSSGTHATKLQTRHSTPMDRVSCSLQNLFVTVLCSSVNKQQIASGYETSGINSTLPERSSPIIA